MKIKDVLAKNEKMNSVMEKKLPVRVAFLISRNVKKLAEVVTDYEEKYRAVVKKYAEVDDKGEMIIDKENKVKIKDVEGINKDLTELADTDVAIEFDMLELEDLEKCDEDGYDCLTPTDLSCLDFMIK